MSGAERLLLVAAAGVKKKLVEFKDPWNFMKKMDFHVSCGKQYLNLSNSIQISQNYTGKTCVSNKRIHSV